MSKSVLSSEELEIKNKNGFNLITHQVLVF